MDTKRYQGSLGHKDGGVPLTLISTMVGAKKGGESVGGRFQSVLPAVGAYHEAEG